MNPLTILSTTRLIPPNFTWMILISHFYSSYNIILGLALKESFKVIKENYRIKQNLKRILYFLFSLVNVVGCLRLCKKMFEEILFSFYFYLPIFLVLFIFLLYSESQTKKLNIVWFKLVLFLKLAILIGFFFDNEYKI